MNPSGRPRKPLNQRLWARVNKGGPDDCWPWQGGTTERGYGKIQAGLTHTGGPTLLTHRVAWESTNGPIPDDLRVLHKCDNPPCCNPSHLFIGTPAVNSQDMTSKGRAHHPVGMTHPMAKLTDTQVLEIRRRYAAGEKQKALADEYGVIFQMVSRIVRRESWAHLPG